MSWTTVRAFAIFPIVLALLALAACGSSGVKVCNATGCCGSISDACPMPEYLYATNDSGQVSAFPVTNGALGTPTTVSGGPLRGFGFTSINNTLLYESDFQNALIYGWSLDLGTGAMTPIQGSPFMLGQLSLAGGLAANNTSGVVYVADVNHIDAFKSDPATGALSAIAGSPFASGANLYLTTDPNNQFLFAADIDPPGGVLAFTIDASSGALTAVPGSPFAIPNFSRAPELGPIVVDSTGSFVFMTLLSTNQVAAFSIVKPSGALTPVPGSPFATAAAPVTLTAVNSYLYVSGGSLTGYSIDPITGVLTPLVGSPFGVGLTSLTANFGGGYLYATGAGGIETFSIDGSTGALTQAAGPPFPDAGATLLTFVPHQ